MSSIDNGVDRVLTIPASQAYLDLMDARKDCEIIELREEVCRLKEALRQTHEQLKRATSTYGT